MQSTGSDITSYLENWTVLSFDFFILCMIMNSPTEVREISSEELTEESHMRI